MIWHHEIISTGWHAQEHLKVVYSKYLVVSTEFNSPEELYAEITAERQYLEAIQTPSSLVPICPGIPELK